MSNRFRRVIAIAPILVVSCVIPASVAATAPSKPTAANAVTSMQLEEISCPSANVCVAAGEESTQQSQSPVIFRTSDAGTTWTSESVAVNFSGSAWGVSCATTIQCLVVAGGDLTADPSEGSFSYLVTTDRGSVWTTHQPNLPITDTAYPSCPTFGSCDAIADGAVIRSMDGGIRWTMVSGGDWESGCPTCSAGWVDDLTCIRATVACFAVGQNAASDLVFARSVNAGTHFDRVAILKNVRGRYRFMVSCGSVRSCMVPSADNTRVLTTTDAGRKWTTRSFPGRRNRCPCNSLPRREGVCCPHLSKRAEVNSSQLRPGMTG